MRVENLVTQLNEEVIKLEKEVFKLRSQLEKVKDDLSSAEKMNDWQTKQRVVSKQNELLIAFLDKCIDAWERNMAEDYKLLEEARGIKSNL